ncbi:MAG: dipeptidase [Planctomycetota bacterium]
MPNKEVLKLHHKSFIVDGHADTFSKILSAKSPGYQYGPHKSQMSDFFQRIPKAKAGKFTHSHMDYHRTRQGGTNLQFMAVYTPPTYTGLEATAYALKMVFEVLQAVRQSSLGLDSRLRGNNGLVVVKSSADLTDLIRRDGMGFLINIEGGNPLNKDLGLLKVFYDLGVRAMGLTHNPRNDLGDGIGIKYPKGLTTFGKTVVKEMNRLGMLIDVAHLAKPGFRDVIRLSRGPIISSHTGVRALRDIPRNLDDEQIKEICRRKGVMGVFYLPDYLKKFSNKKNSATVKDVVNHIQYIADKFGVDYVGLGSDWDGYGGITYGLEDCSYLHNITAELAHRGFNQTEIKKILGGNFVRVIKQILR